MVLALREQRKGRLVRAGGLVKKLPGPETAVLGC
jgi:hypothetical protein